MKSYYDIPTIWRIFRDPLPVYYRLNISVGVTVWRPRNSNFFDENP